ncbi:MAG TPA: NifU family protein [Blastocatellia bacterium]|jgi:Fe-S cluster biogenesis protein NfuA|nr:NifU family protein [Blastocatellia bacterium]
MLEDNEFQQRIQKIEGLVRKIESMADEKARASALELFQSIMDLHGAGLERMMSAAFDAGDAGRRIIETFAEDELVSSLLLLYGLHPLDLQARVEAAIDKMRPMLRSHGGSLELVSIVDGVVRLRLDGSCKGCGLTAQALKQSVEEAVYDAAPDMSALYVAGAVEHPSASGLVQLKSAITRESPARPVTQQVGYEEGGLATMATDLS